MIRRLLLILLARCCGADFVAVADDDTATEHDTEEQRDG